MGRRSLPTIQDRKRFLETLEEACQRTGWLIHAYMLMGNHYHLLVETPEANLVAGMKWLQSAYTQRYNRRHKVFGHLFQGRYKAIIVDGQEPMYFQVVSTYIHLNPARAGLIRYRRPTAQGLPLEQLSVVSEPGWQRSPNGCIPGASMGSLGLAEKEAEVTRPTSRAVCWNWAVKLDAKNWMSNGKQLRRGWYVGTESFGEKLKEGLQKAVQGRRRESHSGPARVAHDQAAAEKDPGASIAKLWDWKERNWLNCPKLHLKSSCWHGGCGKIRR